MSAAKRYRVDYTPDDNPDGLTVIFMADGPLARARACSKARQISATKSVSSAYAIASLDGKDTGQRVYSYGAFSHKDGDF